jgi:hypothetical protein
MGFRNVWIGGMLISLPRGPAVPKQQYSEEKFNSQQQPAGRGICELLRKLGRSSRDIIIGVAISARCLDERMWPADGVPTLTSDSPQSHSKTLFP